MKLFTKVTLVTAIAISSNAMAMQAMNDQSLSAATGQDGITIKIAPQTTDAGWRTWAGGLTPTGGATIAGGVHIGNVYVHDKDGLTGNLGTAAVAGNNGPDGIVGNADDVAPIAATGTGVATAQAGAITIAGVDVASTGPITVTIDADGNGNTAKSAVLNVKVALNETFIKVGEIGVTKSNRAGTTWGVDSTSYNKILNPLTLHMGATNMNIQLGAQPQGAMIKLSGSMIGGLAIDKLELFDNDGVAGSTVAGLNAPGSIYVGSLSITDTNSANLTTNANVDVSAAGLVLTSNGGPMDIRVSDVRLGNVAAANSAASIGDIELLGVNATGTKLIITGH